LTLKLCKLHPTLAVAQLEFAPGLQPHRRMLPLEHAKKRPSMARLGAATSCRRTVPAEAYACDASGIFSKSAITLILAVLLFLCAAPVNAEPPLRVAVAANFKPTLETLNRRFTADTGIAIRLSSASTGMLATQLRHGAPFDVFFAADAEHAAGVARLDLPGAGEPFCYAVGALALAGGALEDLARAEKSVAIANPATAPYGRAALDVLARDQFTPGANLPVPHRRRGGPGAGGPGHRPARGGAGARRVAPAAAAARAGADGGPARGALPEVGQK